MDIAYFLNGEILDISKLPKDRPLEISNKGVGGRPLDEFLIRI